MEPDGAEDSGNTDRLGILTQELVRDVSDWIQLRVDLFGLEVARGIKARQGRLLTYAIAAVLGGAALLLMLVAASLGLGSLLDNAALGFLLVGAAVAIGAAGTYLGLRRSYGDEAHGDKEPEGRGS